MRGIAACFLCLLSLSAAQVWSVRVEEPTGLYRRTNEVVLVPLPAGNGGWTVVAPDGRELPSQQVKDGLLIPVSVVPGELPVYRITTYGRVSYSTNEKRPPNEIIARKIGLRRIEIGNSRFRMMIDTGVPAIIEAYNLTAAEHHRLNFVEATPESTEFLKTDIHTASDIPPKVPGVDGENIGWTSLGGGPIDKVDILENGPLRGHLRLSQEEGAWEFEWTAASPAVVWKSMRGFRFLSVSATPYIPFDRCVSGEEYTWPQGPEHIEPPDHDIAPRNWKKLPGGSVVYYNDAENYGALGIVALDDKLNWAGIGSRRFVAEKPEGPTEIALLFSEWDGFRTTLNLRRESAIIKDPVIVKISGPREGVLSIGKRQSLERPYPVVIRFKQPEITPFQPTSLSLDGEWRLAYSDKGADKLSDARRVNVPGSVHTQWYPGDPFSTPLPKYYTHEADWISYKEWWYSKTFSVPASFSGKRLRLQFDATDYYADAYLNGKYLGRHEGYIDPYEYDVTDKIRCVAENGLKIRIWTPVTYYWRHRPYYVKGSYGAVDQKPDDITAEGITRSVRLTASGQAAIGDIAIDTRLLDDRGAKAEVDVNLETEGNAERCTWELSLSPRNFSSGDSYRINAPAMSKKLIIPIDQPHLWWTWDHGAPNLYTLDVRLLDGNGKAIDGKSLAIGIREVEKIGWDFYLNRRRMFIRGTNYYYNLFLSEMNRSTYERDLDLMLRMNVNMIRLHTHFTNPEFYDLADEKGVFIWQDYLEAWYPHDPDFALRAASLYDPLIKYVRNHPCIAIWSTSDEEDLENYRVITKHLAPRPSLLDPQRRPVVRSTGRYGDAHVYHGWYEGSVWEYTNMTEPFVSELGATALPNYDTITKFLPDGWPIHDHEEEWVFRKLQIPEAMRAWGSPDGMTLQEYIPQTQAYVARLFQIALERSRRLKYNPAGGILHFHAIDIWPSVTMAAIDFYRQPTQAFYTVQRSFAPVVASLEYDRDRWKPGEQFHCGVWAINDEWYEIPNAQVRWQIVDERNTLKETGRFPVSMDADSSKKLGEVRWTADKAGKYELRSEVFDTTGKQLSENVFQFQIQ